MSKHAIQDYYPDDVAHCYGCGRLNEYGHQLKTYWDDGETVAEFTPRPYHTAIPGYVYGGLIADHRAAIETIGRIDPITEDLLIGHTADLELFQWFVRAHLQDSDGDVTFRRSES